MSETLGSIGSIFRGNLHVRQHEAVAEPPARVRCATPTGSRPQLTIEETPITTEAMLMQILEAPLPAGLTAAVAYRMKEEALATVIARLSVKESRELYKRLATPVDGDTLALTFTARLTSDRRNRLLVFLADARRREALAARR